MYENTVLYLSSGGVYTERIMVTSFQRLFAITLLTTLVPYGMNFPFFTRIHYVYSYCTKHISCLRSELIFLEFI